MNMRALVRAGLWTGGIGLLAVVAASLWLMFPGAPADGRSVVFKGFIPLPKGEGAGLVTVLDYITVAGPNLFVANSSTGTIYRVRLHDDVLPTSADVSLLRGEPSAHGVVIDPASGLAYVTRSEANTVDVFDPSAMRALKRIPVGDDPDGIFYLSPSHTIYVANGDAAVATLIDPASQTVTGSVSLGGKPEYGAFDAVSKRFFQTLQSANAVASIDPVARRVDGRWPVAECDGPTGMAIDVDGRRLFIGCSRNAKLVVFDIAAHKVVAQVPVGSGPDSVAYDSALHRIYVTGRSGILTVIQAGARRSLSVLDTISLHYGAHTLAVDPATHALFVGYASLLIGPRIAVFAPKVSMPH